MTTPTESYDSLSRGDAIRVAFGGTGSQLAVVAGRNRANEVIAHKYSIRSHKWTAKPVAIPLDRFVGRVSQHYLNDTGNPLLALVSA